MKYSLHTYANALAQSALQASSKESEKVSENFLELLKRAGDEAHLSKILNEAERIMRAHDGTQRIVVRVARKQKQSAKELVKHFAGPHDAILEEIDPSLIAGMKVVVNDEREYDGSLKTKLEAMLGTI